MAQRQDVYTPMEATDGGDLRAASGAEKVRQRVLRGLFTSPGELKHRPGWGAGLREYQNAVATPQNIQEVANRITAFLDPLEAVVDYDVAVTADDGEIVYTIAAETRDGEFEIPEATLADS